MKNRVSLGGQLTGSLWTTLFAGGLIAVACSWITLTSYSAQAAGDPNNILLDFSARWCGPCQQMSPIVSKLERQGYPIRQVDVDQERDLAKKYDVSSIPCFVLIANGKEINRITGATDEKQLRKLMTLLPKQNIDEPLAGKSRANSADSQASSKSTDGKKGFLALPPLFPKKTKDAAASRSEEVETVRGQDPDRPAAYNEFAREAITASTRIRVKDGSHVHYGSGTIIDSQPGQAVILTCGHILRKLSKNAQIEVDLFADGISNPMTTTAQILKYDLEADVGLLTVSCQERLPVVKLAFSSKNTLSRRSMDLPVLTIWNARVSLCRDDRGVACSWGLNKLESAFWRMRITNEESTRGCSPWRNSYKKRVSIVSSRLRWRRTPRSPRRPKTWPFLKSLMLTSPTRSIRLGDRRS